MMFFCLFNFIFFNLIQSPMKTSEFPFPFKCLAHSKLASILTTSKVTRALYTASLSHFTCHWDSRHDHCVFPELLSSLGSHSFITSGFPLTLPTSSSRSPWLTPLLPSPKPGALVSSLSTHSLQVS